jgi:multidrug efflux system outer membrane protein
MTRATFGLGRSAPPSFIVAGALIASAVLAACSMAPEYTRPDVDPPPRWRVGAEEAASFADLPWWDVFQDPSLQALIRTGLAESKDVRIAASRIAQARAAWTVARSRLLPQIGTGVSVIPERLSQVGFPLGLSATSERLDDPNITLSEVGLGISFDLDLWGKLRSASDAARFELLASEEARQAVVVMLLGDLAQTYFDLRELDLELEITRATRATRIDTLQIVRLRQEHGLVSDLDVRQAEIQVDTTDALIPDLERRIAQTENRLSVLLGLNPGPIQRGRSLTAETVPPQIPAGLPSALLERRPDLRQAEKQIVAANFRIGEARAAFFPNILLTGALGVQSLSLSDLFTTPARFWQVGPTITLPLYTGGRLSGQLSVARARTEEALIRYARVVQQAFREVNDGLTANQQTRRVVAVLERQLEAARDAQHLAELRYLNGLTNYLDVLEAQRVVFATELELARARRDLLVAVVQIYKALGGGWNAADGLARSPGADGW